MSLYYYKKAPPKIIIKENKLKKIKRTSSLTVAAILDNLYFKISQKISRIKPISFILPFVFIICGLSILYGQAKPYAVHYIQSNFSDKLNQEIIALVPESYEDIRSSYISDPGGAYFLNILESQDQNPEILEFTGKFYITIEKIKIINAPITANVDSSKEEVYQEALSKGLAHLRGTSLPGYQGNILIYGHSAAGDYAEKNPGDVVTAFTRLFKLNIGDEITLKFNDNQYTYIVKKIKEVNPDNVDVLNNTGNNNLTLITCSPPGLSSKRLVITAIQQ